MSTSLTTLTRTLAGKLEMGDGTDLIDTLKATAFKGQVSDAQMTALLVVANQYMLNPWTKEIYAFPDKNNGIVPVVGVDGWSRIINTHPQFDGIEFEQTDDACTCVIYRKDRNRPIKVTEWMAECKRGTGPWQSHPRRMLRHKAMIQCARLAFGYVGIYDQDEAERIVEGPAEAAHSAPPSAPQPYDQTHFDANFPKWSDVIAKGRKSPADLIVFIEAKGNPLTEEQKARILSVKRSAADVQDVQPKAKAPTFAEVADRINAAETHVELDALDETIGAVVDAQQRAELVASVERRHDALPAFD